jgi:hypothetical protein
MVDEMDLLSALKAAPLERPQALEEARAVLRTALAAEREARETQAPPRRLSRRGSRRRAVFGAVGLAAAAAAVTLVVTSTSGPGGSVPSAAHPGGQPGGQPAASAAAQPAARPANPELAQLAARVTAQPAKLPGNATLEIRNQSPTSDTPGDNGLDLYADDGTYYWSGDASTLPEVVAQHQATAQGEYKRDIAAALYAVHGDLATARARMSVANFAPGAGQDTAAASEKAEIEELKAYDKRKGIPYTPPKPLTPAQEQEHTDNFIWMNATGALTAAPDNTQVRAGVLRILATMPNVKVTHTTTAGQATLTLSDSWPLLMSPQLVESLVINASTGFPVAEFNREPGQPLNVTYYHVSRVTLSDVAAGRF